MTAPYQPADRRPVAARSWPVWQRAAAWLAGRGVSPNAISLAGMACGVGAGLALAATAPGGGTPAWLAAAALIQLRLLANLLDGMVAVASGRASPVGELYNEVPDRVSDAAALVGAGYAAGGDPALGFTAALAAVFTAYARAAGKAAGAPQDYGGPMAKQQRMMTLTAAALYAGLAPAAWQPLWEGRGVVAAALLAVAAGSVLTTVLRLRRIAASLRARS